MKKVRKDRLQQVMAELSDEIDNFDEIVYYNQDHPDKKVQIYCKRITKFSNKVDKAMKQVTKKQMARAWITAITAITYFSIMISPLENKVYHLLNRKPRREFPLDLTVTQ